MKEHVHSDELSDFAERLGNAISMKGIYRKYWRLRDDQGDYYCWLENKILRAIIWKTEEIEDPDDTDSPSSRHAKWL